jgi:hypothetical protein
LSVLRARGIAARTASVSSRATFLGAPIQVGSLSLKLVSVATQPGGTAQRRQRSLALCKPAGALSELTATWPATLHLLAMAPIAPELLTLLIAERLAWERLKRLQGYPDKDVVEAAEKLWREAAKAVRDYRANNT